MVLQMLNDILLVYFLPFNLPLRPIHLPLTFSMTLNGTERQLNGTERYFKCSMVYRALSFLPFKVPLRPTNVPLMSSMVLNGTERY